MYFSNMTQIFIAALRGKRTKRRTLARGKFILQQATNFKRQLRNNNTTNSSRSSGSRSSSGSSKQKKPISILRLHLAIRSKAYTNKMAHCSNSGFIIWRYWKCSYSWSWYLELMLAEWNWFFRAQRIGLPMQWCISLVCSYFIEI